MALFGFGKKKTEESCCCGGCCGDAAETTAAAGSSGELLVKVLGSGCAKCNQLESAVKEAMKQLGLDPVVEHVSDYAQIAAFGVMSTPALVINGKVVSSGKVLKTEEIVRLLSM